MVTEVTSLIAEARRHGRLELVDGRVVVEGRFPKTLARTLRARKEEIRSALRSPVIGPLAEQAARLAPGVRLTVHETENVEEDIDFLRRLRLTIEEYPGANLVVTAIRTLDGRKVRAEWRALASPALRRRLAEMLRERAQNLGLIVDRRASVCRGCGGDDLARGRHGRLFCPACHVGRLRGGS